MVSKDVNNEVIKYLSYNVLYLRKKHNITKKDMARILGVGIKTLNKIEHEILPPRLSVDILFKIQKRFGISVSSLVSEDISKST